MTVCVFVRLCACMCVCMYIVKWFRKSMHVALLPMECVVNCRSLYVLGYSRPTKGVSYRAKHMCEPDPRAHLQDLFMQRSARKWRFDFHIAPPLN